MSDLYMQYVAEGLRERIAELEAQNKKLKKALLKAVALAEEHDGKFSAVEAIQKHVHKALGR